MSNVKVKGLADLQKFLDQLSPKLESNIMRSALRKGCQVIAAEAKQLCPVDHGDLRDSIRASARLKNGTVIGSVKAGNAKAWYWRFVEYGTAAHWIKVKEEAKPWRLTRRGVKTYSTSTLNRMAKRGSLIIGGSFVGQSVEHPGAKATPFMRPALDGKAAEALQAVGEQIKKRLTKQGLNAAGVDIEVES